MLYRCSEQCTQLLPALVIRCYIDKYIFVYKLSINPSANHLSLTDFFGLYSCYSSEFFGCGKKRDLTQEKAIKDVVVKEYNRLGRITLAFDQLDSSFVKE